MYNPTPILVAVLSLCVAKGLSVPAVGPPICSPRTELVGNGNPHQNYYNIQVSDNLQCGGSDTCDVSHLTSKTVGWSASAGLAQWISGGFDVSESYTTGNTYGCNGNAGQTVCVFDKIAHTAYTVETYGFGDECRSSSGPIVVKSPNTNNAGGNYYCVYDSGCHEVGYNYWDDNGAATGPPS